MTDGGVKLPLKSAPSGSDGRPCIYGIRPEHLTLGGEAMKAEVSVIEPTGSETQVFAKFGDQKIVGVFRERMSRASRARCFMLSPNLDAVHLFDADDRQRGCE